MRSSFLYYWFGRWGLIVMAFAFGGFGALGAYRGELLVAAVFGGVFIGLLGFALWIHDRIAVVTLAEEGVEVRRGGETGYHRWAEIASISRVRRTVPPAYLVSFRGGHLSVYCVVADLYVAVDVMGYAESRDLTGFGEYAQAQILRASIEAEKARMVTEGNR